MLLLAVSALVVFVGALAFHFGRLLVIAEVSGGATSLTEAMQWSLHHALERSTLSQADYEHNSLYLIGVVITVIGVVLSSILIGLISSSFTNRMNRLRLGVTDVGERDHILLLGWSLRAMAIVRYFVTRQNKRKVVILSSVLPDDIDGALRQAGLSRASMPLVIRTGDPTSVDELERVSIKDAGAIIAVSTPQGSAQSAEVDATVIKTLMTIKSYFADSTLPNIVAEIADRAHRDVADVATGQKIPYLVRRDVESRLLVQLCRYPGLGFILAKIWGHSDLNIVLKPVAEFAGRTVADLSQSITGAAFIGVSWREVEASGERDALVLNPPGDYELDEDDSLVLITSPRDTIRERTIKDQKDDPPYTKVQDKYMQCPKRLLILGCNEAIDEVIVEFDAHAFRGGEVHVLCNANEIENIDLDVDALKNVVVHYHAGDPWRRTPLAAVKPESFDVVLVLAEPERTGSTNDAATVLTLLLLNDVISAEERPTIICEINNNANRDLVVPDLADDVIVSPDVVSIQLARIAEEPLLGAVNKELSSAGGVELALYDVGDYAAGVDAVNYAAIKRAALANNETAVGVFNTLTDEVTMYPAPDAMYSPEEGMQVIVLAHQVFA